MRLAATLVWLAALPPPVVAAGPAQPMPEVLMQVQLNGVDTAEAALLLRDAGGRLLVRAADLRAWRMRLPAAVSAQQDGEDFYRLDDIAGLRWQADEARQALTVQADAALFLATELDLTPEDFVAPSPSPPGGFLNYDITSSRVAGQWQTGSLLELGAFNGRGGGVAGFAAREGYATGPHLLRLETTYTRDLPAQRASLRVGDAISRAGQWGRSVRFGGAQWATNFATQPGLVTFPLPSLAGEAVLPSTVDLYVNDALQLHRDVPAGPFSLQELPVISGQGQARLVVRDLLGREQVIVAPYYATPRLLRAGLHDFSYEAGRIREDYGLASNHYGRPALAATHRLGLGDRLTAEAHAEWLQTQQAAGLGAVLWMPGFGTVNAALAASRSDRGEGRLLTTGADHQGSVFGFGISAQSTSSGFAQVGQQPGQPAVRRNLQLYANLAVERGSLSVSYLAQDPRDRDPVQLLSLGYGVSLGAQGYLSISLLRSSGPQGRVVAGLNFTHALDGRTTLGAGATAQPSGGQQQVQVQRNLPSGNGTGYRVLGITGANQRVEAGASLQHSAGTAGLEVAQSGGQTALRGSAAGGLAWLDGGLYASRRIDSSFAVVQVPGQPGVGVYADNQLVARTAADGSVLLPRLRPFQKNPVRIEQADIPLDAQVDSLQLDAVPAYRSGLVLRFPVRRTRSATLRLLRENGRAVPAGARARTTGVERAFPFGLDGQLYLEGLGEADHITVSWPEASHEGHCSFDLALGERGPLNDSEALPDLGVRPCRTEP